jgi:hypothetical protein
MGRYVTFVGRRVEAQYRTANIHQRSVGKLVADTGESVTIEEHFSQGGRNKTMRVEIPYEYVIRIVESPNNSDAPVTVLPPLPKTRR